ncbi:TetR/AcrR family transcriptional regulator [Galbibacter sp. BG1]|uniref:TetR/AcrR family transcriptional regulator n=1 Tax=Galbibacter sp. BG1 TaxID=1170699 RepID=UPI0015BA2603|nr:TetR/AcrR family transcriptional regulator [Galbibacter sp. BG1]QLE00042.1 TetR/AcrR family transcriptional regulator [Galbibacter sp. BG1]
MATKGTDQKILEAAKKIFILKGYAGARMQEIADEANINKSMLHYYYKSKDVLFSKIMEQAIVLLAPKFIEAISGDFSVIEKLQRLVVTYINTISKHPHIPLFMLHELSQNRVHLSSKLKKHMKTPLENFAEEIKQEQKKGIIKKVPVNQLILTVMSLIVFPFVAEPIFKNVLEISEKTYRKMMMERKEIVLDLLKTNLL